MRSARSGIKANDNHVPEFNASGTSPGYSFRPKSPLVVSISPRLLAIPTAAAYIGATNWFVEELLRSGELPFLIVGKHRVIDIQDLDFWVSKQKKQTGQLATPKIFANRKAA